MCSIDYGAINWDKTTKEKQKLCDDLNEIVDAEYCLKTPTPSKKQKRGEYRYYSPQQKAKIARYAIDNGATKAARHFSEKLGTKLNDSTVLLNMTPLLTLNNATINYTVFLPQTANIVTHILV
jgi:hypothetical protein